MDYKAIIEQLDDEKIKQLLDKLGIPFEDKGDYLIMPTACHNEDLTDASWKLYYYKNNHLFMCYTECGTMSVFKFLKFFYETRNIEYNWYDDVYKVIIDCSNFKEREGFVKPYHSLKDKFGNKRKEKELPVYSENVLDCFVKSYPVEWLEDGISKAAMDKFDIRFSISQNKIVIPHYDINGRLVGIRGRALDEWEIENVGKYLPLQIEGIWYKHPLSMNLYGLYENQENIKKHKICYVFEAEKSVLQLENFGLPHCGVAVCGSNFNKFQLNLLLKHCAPTEIVICFDKEELPGQDKYFNKLYSIGKKYQNYCNFSFVYDRKNLLDMKDSPTDKGEEIFKQLLERRIQVK